MYQVEKGAMQYLREPIVWQDLLRDAVAAYEGAVEERGGYLQLIIPEKPVHGIGDRRHLLNSIAAVIDNAVKYSDRSPAVFITLEASPGAVQLQVQDNGIGITDAQQKRIFRKFYRVPTGNVHDVKGFGLGLSYVDETVRAHGGEIEVKSTPGIGTTFTLTFPLTSGNSSPLPLTPTSAPYAGHSQG
jgi:two-component system phosphate regulon sensor histidine kinase PhoR